VYAAAMVLPFFVIYHAGTVVFRTTYVNGADALIVRILSLLSVHSVFASALVLLAAFVIWQLKTRASWRIDSSKLIALYVESLLFAVLLYLLFGWMPIGLSRPAPGAGDTGLVQQLVLYCGAGVYEELVFRGFLLTALMFAVTRLAGFRRAAAAVVSAVAAALLFSLFHYVGPQGDSFALAGFVQRALGGLYFSILFVTRGFGVAAATHALYDVIVGLSRW
jgi:membrane protease YdiL (CAAX protease family)